MADSWSLNLPLADFQREPDELEKQPLQFVNTIAEKYANPSHASMLLVGDASKIEAGVRGLKLHDVVRLDVEGRPVSGKSAITATPLNLLTP